MLFIYTAFDPSKDGRPLMSGVFDSDIKKLSFYTFYISNSGKTYYEIEKAKEEFRKLFKTTAAGGFYGNNKKIIINDYKQHIIGFNIKNAANVYDIPIPQINKKMPPKIMRKAIIAILKVVIEMKPEMWHKLRANASIVYAHLQFKGAMFGYTLVHPIWSISTYSGRSKATEFAMQGLSTDDPIANINNDRVFIHFDWVAADLRAAAIISKDEKLNLSFDHSNPYDYMADHMNKNIVDNKLERAEAKEALLSSMYRMDTDGPVMEFYSGLKDWIINCRNNLDKIGYIESIVGRKFKTGKRFGEDRSERSAFNATIQGSVASAMQVVIYEVYKKFPDNLLCETHDSLIVTSNGEVEDIRYKIDIISNIMIRPFKNILKSNPIFPLVVSVGKKFGKWKKYKRFNK